MSSAQHECVFAQNPEAGPPDLLIPDELLGMPDKEAEQLGEEQIIALLSAEVCPRSQEQDAFLQCHLTAASALRYVLSGVQGGIDEARRSMLAEVPLTCRFREIAYPHRATGDSVDKTGEKE
jgi:hypothetical protein